MATQRDPGAVPVALGTEAGPTVAAALPTAQDASPPSAAAPHPATLFVLMVGTFMSVLDFFIVNVAIPSVQKGLDATPAAIQFVVAGYALSFGAGLVIGGRLGDIYGRRRMFVVGMSLFTVASVVCGLAPSAGFLVVARIVQGAAAAVMSPQVLSIISTAFPPADRVRAFTAYGVTMGLAAVFGQLIGGALIQADLWGWGWRSCFFINLPIGLAAIAAVPVFVPDVRAPGRPRLDLGGMVLIAAGVTALVLPLIEGRQQGWPLWSWVCLAAAVPLLAAFGLYETWLRRGGGSPIMDLRLFRERAFTVGLLSQTVFYLGQASFFLMFAVYVQGGRGLDPLQAGLLFMAIGSGYTLTSLTASKVAARWGRQVIAAGAGLRIVGLLVLMVTVRQASAGSSTAWLIPGLFIDGAGMGLAVAPLASTILSRLTPQHAGAASGVLNTAVWIGNAIGVAIIGVIFYGRSDGAGFQDAFAASLWYLCAVCLVLVATVQLLPGRPAAPPARG